jgi:hypothetical protein
MTTITRPLPFEIGNSYWSIAGDTSRFYSTKIGDYVVPNDPTFQGWTQAGGTISLSASEAALGDILYRYLTTGTVLPTISTALVIQQKLRLGELHNTLVPRADIVQMIEGGVGATTTGDGVALYLATCANNDRTLRRQINLATTPEAVRAIDINSGWPANP